MESYSDSGYSLFNLYEELKSLNSDIYQLLGENDGIIANQADGLVRLGVIINNQNQDRLCENEGLSNSESKVQPSLLALMSAEIHKLRESRRHFLNQIEDGRFIGNVIFSQFEGIPQNANEGISHKANSVNSDKY